MNLTITRWRSIAVLQGERQIIALDVFGAELQARSETPFDGSGWSPATFKDDRRHGSRVELVHALCLECDDGSCSVDKALEIWKGEEGIVHTTKSHTAKHPRIRIVLALPDGPVDVEKHAVAWVSAEQRMFEHGAVLDRAARGAGRLWFWPAAVEGARVARLSR